MHHHNRFARKLNSDLSVSRQDISIPVQSKKKKGEAAADSTTPADAAQEQAPAPNGEAKPEETPSDESDDEDGTKFLAALP